MGLPRDMYLSSILRSPYTTADGPHTAGLDMPEVVHDVVWKRTSTGQMFLYLCYLAAGTGLRCIEAEWLSRMVHV